MMVKIVIPGMVRTTDRTLAKETTMTKYHKLMKMAIKTVMRKDSKKDTTIVKKYTMVQL